MILTREALACAMLDRLFQRHMDYMLTGIPEARPAIVSNDDISEIHLDGFVDLLDLAEVAMKAMNDRQRRL